MKRNYWYSSDGKVKLGHIFVLCLILGSGAFGVIEHRNAAESRSAMLDSYKKRKDKEGFIEELKREKDEIFLNLSKITTEVNGKEELLKTEAQEKENALTELAKERSQKESLVNELKNLKKESDENVNILKSVQEELDKVKSNLNSTLVQHKKDTDELNQELSSIKTKAEKLQTELKERSSQLVEKETKLAKIQKERDELEQKFVAASKSLSMAKEELDQRKEERDYAINLKKNYDEALKRMIETVTSSKETIKKSQERMKACASYTLGVFQYEAAIEPLIKTLSDKAPEVQYSAAFALGEFGPKAAVAVPFLEKLLLNSPDKEVAAEAARALGKIGLPAVPVIPSLIDALDDVSLEVRESAASALGKIGQSAVPSLNECLNAKNKILTYHAIKALGDIGPAAASSNLISTLIGFLQDEGGISEVARGASETLGKMGKFAVPGLVETLLNQKDDRVLRLAINSLAMLGPVASSATTNLAEMLKNEAVREDALVALAKIGEPSIPSLIKALGSQDQNVCEAASKGLSIIGKPTVPLLISALNDDNSIIQLYAVKTLGKVPVQPQKVVPILMDILSTATTLDKMRAVCATLGTLGEEGLNALSKALKDKSQNIRYSAIEALENIGPKAKPIAASIRRAHTDTFGSVRYHVAICLGEFGGEKEIIVLKILLNDQMPEVRKAAEESLQKIETRRKEGKVEDTEKEE